MYAYTRRHWKPSCPHTLTQRNPKEKKLQNGPSDPLCSKLSIAAHLRSRRSNHRKNSLSCSFVARRRRSLCLCGASAGGRPRDHRQDEDMQAPLAAADADFCPRSPPSRRRSLRRRSRRLRGCTGPCPGCRRTWRQLWCVEVVSEHLQQAQKKSAR
jgi:hypothetical protein